MSSPHAIGNGLTPRFAAFRYAVICIFFLGASLRFTSAESAHRSLPKRPQVEVLFLSSLDPDLPDVAAMIEQTERQIIVGSDKPARFSFEYLDFSSAIAGRARRNVAASYLNDKYRGKTFQLVIAIGEETVLFAEQMRAKLFPDGALLFFVVNPQNASNWLEPSTTGVIREVNYQPTLQLALQQNPGTSHVIVVSGSSDEEKLDLKIARDQFQKYESNPRFEYLTDIALIDLTPRLASAQADTVILFLDFATDSSGEQFIPSRILPAISRAVTRPIYGTFSSVVGNGVVGGSVADLVDVGRILGHDAVRILKGERPESISVTTGDFQHYVIDWRQLHRWGFSPDQLPKGSEVRYWEYSPWELYRWRILGLSAILLMETLLIALLLRNVVRRKRAQVALTSKEKELAEAQRLAQIGSWFWDATNEELSCSEELYRIYGLDPASPLPTVEELSRRFTPANWVRLTVAIEKAWEADSIQEIELEAERFDRSKKWVRIRGEAVRNGSGRVTYLRGTVQDITDRKKSQATLQESRSRLTSVIDSAMDAIIAVDDQQVVLLFNTSAEKMFGCPASDAIGRCVDRFIPQRFRAQHHAHLHHFGETGATSRAMGTLGALWAVRSNGEEFPIEASISNIEDGGKKLFTVIIRDVTERQRSEAALAESEKRFRLIANTAPVLIWMAGPDKLCNYFNQPWLEFTGRSLEKELGNGWAEGVHPHDLRKCLDKYTEYFDRREKFRMEYRLRRHDGEYRWILDIGAPRFNSDGSFAGYVGCCMDISDLKEARATVVEFSGRLMRAGEEERARLARDLHDDINQRLALLANRIQECDQATSAHTDLSQKKELREMWRLTNEIATDIQHMSHQLHPSKLHYLGLAATVRDLCREFSGQHKIEVECVVQDLPRNLDENVSLNLFRTVQEALRNVVKHSHARQAKVELTYQSGLVQLRVSDDGVGFKPEDAKTNRGLGLVSMRERLRSVGGEFSIWSRPSLGTQVQGTVPATTTLESKAEEIETA